MISRGLFGWSPPHIQSLTLVSEVSEPPESPSPYMDANTEQIPGDLKEEIDEGDEIEPPPAAVPFSGLFACADGFNWVLIVVGSLAAAAHGTAMVVYLHYFAKKPKIIHLLVHDHPDTRDILFDEFRNNRVSLNFI